MRSLGLFGAGYTCRYCAHGALIAHSHSLSGTLQPKQRKTATGHRNPLNPSTAKISYPLKPPDPPTSESSASFLKHNTTASTLTTTIGASTTTHYPVSPKHHNTYKMPRVKKGDAAAAAAAAAPVAPVIEQAPPQLDESVPGSLNVEVAAFLALRDSVRLPFPSMPS